MIMLKKKEIVLYGSLFLLTILWFVNLILVIVTGENIPIIVEIMMFLLIVNLGMLILLLRDLGRI